MLTPSERCALIARRLRDSFKRREAQEAKTRKQKRTLWERRFHYARLRRAYLEAERRDWWRAIHDFHGNMTRVARFMGYARESAYKAVWDLGYWPELMKIRREDDGASAKHRTRMRPRKPAAAV